VTDNDRSAEGWELYDLSRDRSETDNLAQKEPERVVLLYRKWRAWAERVSVIPFPEDRRRGNDDDRNANVWKSGKMTVKASHCFRNDTLAAILADTTPAGSADRSKPKHTFWPRKGTEETVTLEFGKARNVRGAKVYWYNDTGRGGCRVPASWHMEYFDGETWRPVSLSGSYSIRKDAFNDVGFEPVEASALRMTVKLRQNFSGGVLRWIPEFVSSLQAAGDTAPSSF